ncbi:MAG: hypothetical protein NC320_05010 [Clostridium sp.]|nr:hypothetical protein [Clostridium sp.]MCM1547318.1 hypothetical protein [Ruminococcus sp.]
MNYLLYLLSSPFTGDNRNVILYVTLAVAAAVLIVVFFMLGKKKKK